MKIEAAENKVFYYMDIETGNCFIHGTDLYLKIWGDDLVDSAVNLRTGEVNFFEETDRVQPVQATVRMY